MTAPKTNPAQELTQGRLLARNTILNVLGYSLPMLVAIFAIPPLVKGLGTERFGILTLAWVIIGYLSLFDLGLGRALTKLVAEKLNRTKGATHVFIPLKGFSFPDRENLPHWEPAGNQAFIDALKAGLKSSIPLIELDAHINDPEFIDPVIDAFMAMMAAHYESG